jgi:hypothetical protein
MRRVIAPPPPACDLVALAERTSYVGSAEHKSYPSFAGQPKLRGTATKCDPSLTDAGEITSWLRAGIAAGLVGYPWRGDFPSYVWCRVEELCYEARLVNRDAGHYKGYALTKHESPEGV